MSKRPSKKRRTIVDSSDESPPRPNTPGTQPSSSSSSTLKAPPTARASSRLKTANPKPKPKLKAVAPPPRKPPSPKKPKKLSGKYKALHSFFGARSQRCTLDSDTQKIELVEEVDDLIEEVSDDEGMVLPPRTMAAKDMNLDHQLPVVSKPGVGTDSKGLLATVPNKRGLVKDSKGLRATAPTSSAEGGPTSARARLSKAKGLKKLTDNRPWSEKYAPKSADELALNKAKVREVQSWLEGVLNGTSRQRVLVLKGPAGTGKTATVEALAGELGVEILEWGNPINAPLREDYREEGAFSSGLSGFFEEFVGRAPKFGGLDLAWSSGEKASTRTPSSQASMADNGMKRLVVVEDFPNTLFTSSTAPLQSFRHTIKSFLAIPPPQPGDGPLPILILIITETASISGPDSFTAHRLLSPEILHHPLVHEINFNKIAPSYMVKALSSIIAQESQQSGRKLGPSKAMLDALSSSGDIRSAIMGLEFLAMNGDLPDKGFSEPIKTTKRRGRPPDRDLNPAERQVLLAVTQRESSFGIFHATGKVVYNKRYGDDPDDPYSPTQIRPPLPNLPYHARAIRIDLDALIDETGTDPQTFIAGIHENFLSSCNPGGIPRQLATADEDILDVVNACLDNLSDSDLLGSRGYGYDSRGGGGGDTAGIRADEISFHTAVRGVMLSLPSPVKRFRDGCSLSNKMFYPMSARLWRERQEIEDSVEWFVGKERETDLCRGGKAEALQERMPYLALIERRREWAGKSVVVRDPAVAAALDKVTVFGSVRKQSDELGEEKVVEKKAGVQAGWRGGVEKKAEWVGIGEAVESLVLSDDDIEDF